MKDTHYSLLKFVYAHFPVADIVGVMLTGSRATYTGHRHSDVDLIIVSSLACRQTHENIFAEGQMYQIIIFPYAKIASIVYEDYTARKGIFFEMFAKGIILLDEKGILRKLQRLIWHENAPINNDHDILALRRHITNGVESLYNEGEIGSPHRLCTLMEIILNTAKLISGKYAFGGKHLDSLLDARPKEQALLAEALNSSLQTKEYNLFIKSIRTLLSPYGGFIEKYTTGYTLNISHENGLLAFIRTQGAKHEKSHNIIEDIRRLCAKDFFCEVFYEGQGQLMEQGVYIYISPQILPIKRVYERLNLYRQQRKTLQLSYPLQSCFYDGAFFGGAETFRKLIPFFSQLSTEYLDTYMLYKGSGRRNYQLTLSFNTLLFYVVSVFAQTEQRHSFLVECFHFFLPTAVDIDGMYSLNQLQSIKEIVLSAHQKFYRKNEGNLLNIAKNDTSPSKLIEQIGDLLRNHTDNDEAHIQLLYTTSEYALQLHVLSHILSIYFLSPAEKFSLVYYLYNLSEEHAIL
jgi:predicted nucleotidyltransferase